MGARIHGVWWKWNTSKLVRQASPYPLTRPKPACGIFLKVSREVIRGWTSRKHKEYWQSISAEKAGILLNLRGNQLKIMTGLPTGNYHVKGCLLRLRLTDSPEYNRCKQAFEMVSNVLCDCATLTVLRFRHLDQHFLKLGDFANISVSKVVHFVKHAGLLYAETYGSKKRSEMVEVQGSLQCLS
jgi:hypothetical protein